ncbi:MAG: glycyl-radical enzyme activating protein [Candidatus Sumerlaeia bacterium]
MSDSASGLILSIDRCSMHDGPGIRTTVFLKGCPLHCLWCHNPESQDFQPEIFFVSERCRLCGGCVPVCEPAGHAIEDGVHTIDRSNCSMCGACVAACPAGALEIKGRSVTVDEVMAEVLEDRDYYETSGGGMTLSGGEPMAQFDFSMALLESAREAGVHTVVETSAFAPRKRMMAISERVDLFLIDWKESDPERHREFTGVDQKTICENIEALDRAGAKILLRCPIIPDLNDRPDHFAGIAALSESMRNIQGIEIMPYHPLGASKSRSIGKTYPLPDTDFAKPERVQQWKSTIARKTTTPLL